MPISRYEIRNEYSLADPELYQAADNDDPEALLEGVAMAGLVGVLRQLGDLAEFAAEIFHNLHEEVMATATRGHGLMIRVKQLEADVPSIEKAFLSLTDHSSFFYSAGVEWHPNLRMDQNLVSKGDIPRFVMDSYEECRGPPQLFLLDKFDVAGAGACLKRYTDPSFFKVDTSAMANANVQREKKFRKAKKKGPHGRYGETPVLVPASHAKLHHLFLEEPDEKGVSIPTHRAKLKRRPHRIFDSKTREGYMEKYLKIPSPEHKMVHEIATSSPLWMSTNGHNESDLDILELRSTSPATASEGSKKIHPPPYREDTRNPSMNLADDSTDTKICEVPSYLNSITDRTPSSFDEENAQRDITGGKAEGSSIGYQSDDIASEMDNYMDAPLTIESEMDTDTELRVKNDFTSIYIKGQPSLSVKNGAHLHSQSSDSQSTGVLTISDEGSNSCKKEVSSFLSSASSRTSAENPHSENFSAERFPSPVVREIASIYAPAYQKNADEDFAVEGLRDHLVSNHTFPGKDALPNNGPLFEPQDFSSRNSTTTLPHCDSGGVVRKCMFMGSKSEGTACRSNQIIYSPHSCRVSHSKSLSGDDSPRSSSAEHLADGENAPCRSNFTNISRHTSNSPEATSDYLEDCNQFEVTKLSDDIAYDSTDVANGDDITSKVPEGEKRNDYLYSEDSTAVSDAPNRFSRIMVSSIGKEFSETSLTNAKTVKFEDHYSSSSIVNLISSETLILLETEDSPDLQEAGLDACSRNFVPDEAINEILGLQGTGVTDDVTPNESEIICASDHELPSVVFEQLGELDYKTDQLETAPIDTEHDSFHRSGVENQVVDANLSPIGCVTEETALQEKIGTGQDMPEFGELPINHQKILNQDINQRRNNFTSPGFIFPPSNLITETKQINLDESPPLPPLPPLQWRMGKLQPASSTSNVTPVEQTNGPRIQIFTQISLKEKNVVQSSTSLEANSRHEKTDLPQKIENEQHQLMMPTQKNDEVALPAENGSRTVKFPESCNPVIDSAATFDKSRLWKVTERDRPQIQEPDERDSFLEQIRAKTSNPQIQFSPQISPKEKNVKQSSTSLEANSKHETTDFPQKRENEQHQLMMPTQKNDEVTSPAEEDRIANGSQTLKSPESCNPVIDSAAAFDKSKLRNVTERDRPQIQKPGEKDSLLEQIRAKSFNLKPAVMSKPSVRGPETNIKVAAILQKAHSIRQALAGSDEDNDGNWSDS